MGEENGMSGDDMRERNDERCGCRGEEIVGVDF